jgi:hypothetical protein
VTRRRVKIIPKPEPEVAAADRRARRRETMRSEGQEPYALVKPIVFFAGGFPPLHEAFKGRPLPEDANGLDFGAFFYGGPFIGNAGEERPEEIWNVDKALLDRADLILAYISDDAQALGATLVQIGWAAARGKPVSLGFAHDLDGATYRQFGLARMLAHRVYHGEPDRVLEISPRTGFISPNSGARKGKPAHSITSAIPKERPASELPETGSKESDLNAFQAALSTTRRT